jgi:hypothetical protein
MPQQQQVPRRTAANRDLDAPSAAAPRKAETATAALTAPVVDIVALAIFVFVAHGGTLIGLLSEICDLIFRSKA